MKFKNTKIEELCNFIGGSQPPKSEFIHEPRKGYIRLIQIRDYKTDAFLTFIPEGSTRKFCSKEDIMIGRYGPPIFQICRGLEGAYNVALLKAEPKPGVDREFLYYFLTQKTVLQYVEMLSARTGGQTGVDLVALNDYPVRLPIGVEDQKKLVAALHAIDRKIELNNRINAQLEAMAKTLYDYWFVQFDFPDVNGKPYKSSGGNMVYNDVLKREIPEGWEDGSLWDIANYFNGLAMQKFRPTGKDYLPVIKIKEMNEGFNEKTEKARIDIKPEAIVENGDILFSWSATLDVKIWSIGKGALNQHIFKVTSKKYPKSFYYFELLNYLQHFKMMADLRKTTMGHITLDHLKQAKICMPPLELLKKLDQMLTSIFKQYLNTEVEKQELTKTRDWLLPMLMNGQVTSQ